MAFSLVSFPSSSSGLWSVEAACIYPHHMLPAGDESGGEALPRHRYPGSLRPGPYLKVPFQVPPHPSAPGVPPSDVSLRLRAECGSHTAHRGPADRMREFERAGYAPPRSALLPAACAMPLAEVSDSPPALLPVPPATRVFQVHSFHPESASAAAYAGPPLRSNPLLH